MMRILFAALVLINASGFANAEDLKCQVDEPVMGGVEVSIPVTKIQGAVLAPDNSVTVKGHKFAVEWQQGDTYESQTRLTMRFGDYSSSMYDFVLTNHIGKGPVNLISFNGLRFQCWVE